MTVGLGTHGITTRSLASVAVRSLGLVVIASLLVLLALPALLGAAGA